jgi:hypothetical protein
MPDLSKLNPEQLKKLEEMNKQFDALPPVFEIPKGSRHFLKDIIDGVPTPDSVGKSR